LTLTLRKEI